MDDERNWDFSIWSNIYGVISYWGISLYKTFVIDS